MDSLGVRKFEYQKPPENIEQANKIILHVEGQEVGNALLEYRNRPFQFYLLSSMHIKNGFRGQMHGSNLLASVNDFLDEKGLPGILLDTVLKNEKAAGMYGRNGWTDIPGHQRWLGYNLSSTNQEEIDKAIFAIKQRNKRKFLSLEATKQKGKQNSNLN